jgi:predicted RNase H-like nuclease (RuvC/YqgF family)
MEQQKSNSSLKAIIIILSILLVGSLTYMYKMSTDNEQTEKTLMSDKEALLNDLNAAKASYDAAIAENSGLKTELEAERAKIEQLIAEVEKSKGDVASLRRYKDDYRRLKRDMDNLMAENKKLKEQNQSLTVERDSTRNALDESRRYNDTLVTQNTDLAKTVEKASKLAILNLRTESYKERSSGKLVATDKASRVDKLKISFTIAANEVAKSGSRMYYVQIIDSKNNVLGEKKTEVFGDYTLTYSFTTNVAYQNKTMDVSEMLPGKDFAKGTYFVNVFDKDQLVANSSFTLR